MISSNPQAQGSHRRIGSYLLSLLATLFLLSAAIYLKSKATRGFNPVTALPVTSASHLPADLLPQVGCLPAEAVLRTFDLNGDSLPEYFIQCQGSGGKPALMAVWARTQGKWVQVAAGEIHGVLQSRTDGYYDLLMQSPNNPTVGRFQTVQVRKTWQGTAYDR